MPLPPSAPRRLALAVLAALPVVAAACLMPSTQSLWIDEASTLQFASEPTLGALLHRLGSDRDSLTQMPLGTVAYWLWVHAGSMSEWGLRAFNIPWVLVLFRPT